MPVTGTSQVKGARTSAEGGPRCPLPGRHGSKARARRLEADRDAVRIGANGSRLAGTSTRVDVVADASPDVFAHNVEAVRRLKHRGAHRPAPPPRQHRVLDLTLHEAPSGSRAAGAATRSVR
jgi:hypothetical protein